MVGHCQMIMTSTLPKVDPCSTVALRHICGEIMSQNICKGSISKKTDFKLWKNHVVPLLPKDSCPYYTIEYCRHTACHVLLPCTPSDFQLCDICFSESSRNVISNKATPAKAKAPLSCLTKEKLVATHQRNQYHIHTCKILLCYYKLRLDDKMNLANIHLYL